MILKSLQEISSLWSTLDADTLILLDVDDTLITPRAGMFRHHSGHHLFIDDMKRQRPKNSNFRSIHAHWRAQRQSILVDPTWPDIIHNLVTTQQSTVYGFTQINTGPYEIIPSVEQWRIDELAQNKIHFTPTLSGQSKVKLLDHSVGYACFDQGVLFTGPFTKRQLLEACLKKLSFKPKKIVFFDDLAVHIEAIGQLAHEMEIEYYGFHYQAASLMPGTFDLDTINYQQKKLMEEFVWLEDGEALLELQSMKK